MNGEKFSRPRPNDKRAQSPINGLAIKEDFLELWKEHFVKYPALSLSLKDIRVDAMNTFYASLATVVAFSARHFQNLGYFAHLTDSDDIRTAIALRFKTLDPDELLQGLWHLCRLESSPPGSCPSYSLMSMTLLLPMPQLQTIRHSLTKYTDARTRIMTPLRLLTLHRVVLSLRLVPNQPVENAHCMSRDIIATLAPSLP
ncbi:hypothetical protein B0H19DRAFT_1371597 [Mycena capillaripes]|nr:hypothetical protein B0H19DRAFT_1371597 [Mycena capillaripes]